MKYTSRKERRIEQTRREIMDAALRVFLRNGYHGATIELIAKEAEMAPASIYHYFKSKEELFRQLDRRVSESFFEIIDGFLKSSGPWRERLERLLHEFVEWASQNREYLQFIWFQWSTVENGIQQELLNSSLATYRRVLDVLERVMQEGIDQGELRPLPAETLAVSFLGMVHAFFCHWLSNEKFDFAGQAPMILDIFFDGARLCEDAEE